MQNWEQAWSQRKKQLGRWPASHTERERAICQIGFNYTKDHPSATSECKAKTRGPRDGEDRWWEAGQGG